ncbi:MAG TPA: division/cell wall cluster transcriptional repressor MraZ [Candidatus Bathyarchaeia archaeon]|nr:division/cell wall cluster transcriptional repressor MraZ [Candidatus Bathyarchaeia archaeon]
MFLGHYEHHLEAKGRLSIPKKFRKEIASGGVLTEGLDGCLFLFPKAKWEVLGKKLAATPLTKKDARAFARFLTFGAFDCRLDKQGRVLIPDRLRKTAQIEKKVIVAGALDRIEIWSKSRFEGYLKKIERGSEEIAERLAELEI